MDKAPTLPQLRILLAHLLNEPVTELRELPGEEDLNYYVRTASDRVLTAKVSTRPADAEGFRFETAMLKHLGKQELDLLTPAPVGEITELPSGHSLRLRTYVPGRPLSTVSHLSSRQRRAWGRLVANLETALEDFNHPDAPEDYFWNPSQLPERRDDLVFLEGNNRALVEYFLERFAALPAATLANLPVGINHNDAHPDNVLLDQEGQVRGLIDCGDAMRTHKLNELAIACAYAGMDTVDPLGAMAELVAGYAGAGGRYGDFELLYDFIAARLCLTVLAAGRNAVERPDNAYLQVSAAPARKLLRQWREVSPTVARIVFARALGQSAYAQRGLPAGAVPPIDLRGSFGWLDLSVGSLELGNYRNFRELPRFCRHVARTLEDREIHFGVGGYGEVRAVYGTDDFRAVGNNGPRWRTTHLGLDVWGPAGTVVRAPYAGTVHSIAEDPTRGGYGPVLILRHEFPGQPAFYTLYGHLDPEILSRKRARQQVQAGDEIARVGTAERNGGWPPHLHFQVMYDLLTAEDEDFPGVAYPEEAEAWLQLCPDPAPLFGLGPSPRAEGPSDADLIAHRKERLGYGLSISYAAPLHVVRGEGQYLFDRTGRRYLDTVNNVAHVGHEHPRVVEAIQRQAGVLNTNSRYLHELLPRFAEELTATLPPELSVVHFVNSGSEANELALRMCQEWASVRNMLALEWGYHGNTGRTIDVSHYKFGRQGGKGAPAHTTLLPLPDLLRGEYTNPATAGRDYAATAAAVIHRAAKTGRRFAGVIHESILSCGGQIVPPRGYLRELYRIVREAGGLCVADEVQTGVGRVGSHWWAFELQGVVPDIVTIGKPLGNGHPLGAVVCTPRVAQRFNGGMEYFNTFGGNPVSCAAGLAVLDVVRSEGLREQARDVGNYTMALLRDLQSRQRLIGDVRGEGLFLGAELVDPTFAPAAAPAKKIKERMREFGFLMSTDGPYDNVLKIKPPLCFTRANAEELIHYLERAMQ